MFLVLCGSDTAIITYPAVSEQGRPPTSVLFMLFNSFMNVPAIGYSTSKCYS